MSGGRIRGDDGRFVAVKKGDEENAQDDGVGSGSAPRVARGSWVSPRGYVSRRGWRAPVNTSRWGGRYGRGSAAGGSGDDRCDQLVVPGSNGLNHGATCDVCGYRGHWARDCRSRVSRAAAEQRPVSGSDSADAALGFLAMLNDLVDAGSADAALGLLARLNGLVDGQTKGGSK